MNLTTRTIATAAAGVSALVISMSSPAVAADQNKTAAASSGSPASGAACSVGRDVTTCFDPVGDVVWVKDNTADGYHVDGVVLNEAQDQLFCHNHLGSAGGWTSCSWSGELPEDQEIGFRGVVTDSNEGVVGNGGSGPEVVIGTS